jgi:nucleoid DNA-binding protein
MSKKILAEALVKKTGYSKYRAEKLVDTFVWLVKRGLGDGKSVELGRLGVLETVTRKPGRKIVRLKHVGPTVITVNKQKKSVKLRSKLDLSTEEEKIANKAAISAIPLPDKECQAPIAPLRRPCAVASVSWRGRAHRVPSRTKQFRNR